MITNQNKNFLSLGLTSYISHKPYFHGHASGIPVSTPAHRDYLQQALIIFPGHT